MALFKVFLSRTIPRGFCVLLRERSTLSRRLFYRALSKSTYFKVRNSENELVKSTFKIKEKYVTDGFTKNDAVVTVAKQFKEIIKGSRSASEVMKTYSRFKAVGKLSNGDFVRILVRLVKSNNDLHSSKDKMNTQIFYETLIHDIKVTSSDLKPFQLADVFWSLGKLSLSDPDLFAHFGNIVEAMKDLTEFSNADLVMILWGHGKTNNASPILFSLIQKEILARGLEELNTKELCQVVWSFARVTRMSAKLFSAVGEVIQERDITRFNNQDLMMLMWAYSEAGVNVKPLFRFFKYELVTSKRLSEYCSRDLSLILWAFSNQEIKARDLFTEVEKEILTRPKIYIDHQSLVVVAWSFACTDNKSPRLFKFLEEKLLLIELSSWSLHRLVRILWSFTKAGFLSRKLLYKVTVAMLSQNFAELSQNDIEEMVYTLRFCEHKVSPRLVSIVESELMRRANIVK